MTADTQDQATGWRHRLHEIIFEDDTPAGKAFDVALIACIVLSIAVVMIDSVAEYHKGYEGLLNSLEWGFTILFTVEYILRLLCVRRPTIYARSFFGLVDVLAIMPTYLSPFVRGTEFLLVIRSLRVLRIFRILKLVQYVGESRVLMRSLHASRRKLVVFLFAVLTIVTIFGSFMYVIEGPNNGEQFSSIPRSVYWAIVTLTTVGYGNISPASPLGQAVASFIMILGYAIVAVPTGIVTAEIARSATTTNTQSCPFCGAEGHDEDAAHCKYCGGRI